MCELFQAEELALMIRATRGRSIDGWVGGWMQTLIRYLRKWMTFGRSLELGFQGGVQWGSSSLGVGTFFQIVFGIAFFRFLMDFGEFWETEVQAKIKFCMVFFKLFFEHDFNMDF